MSDLRSEDDGPDMADAMEQAWRDAQAEYDTWMNENGDLMKNRAVFGPRHDPYGRTTITVRVGGTPVSLVQCSLAGTYVTVCGEKQDWTGLAAEQHFEELAGIPLRIIEHHLRSREEDQYPCMGCGSYCDGTGRCCE